MQKSMEMASTATPLADSSAKRHHDLDALRAFAMLLGIALHGALSFVPIPWPVQDSQQHGLFGLFVAAVHGFRMPVFFVMSGFFTAMLWRRRGLQSLLRHRFQRIVLPLFLGILTVVPAVNWISSRAIESASNRPASLTETVAGSEAGSNAESNDLDDLVNLQDLDGLDATTGLTALSRAAANDSADSARRLLEKGASVDAANRDGSTPLIVASLFGSHEVAALLIEAGAAIDSRSADSSTALHTAAFFGHAKVVEQLLEAGADLSLVNGYGQTPLEVVAADWQTTSFFAQMVGLELEQEQLEVGRAQITQLFAASGAESVENTASSGNSRLAQLMYQPFFHHLWFLWFLCWLAVAFAVYAALADRFGWQVGRRFVLSPWRLLWLAPITFVPQHFMGRLAPVFGADTSAGVVPLPHVLAFYGIFFFFGALYYDARDNTDRVGRWWFVSLPVSLLIIFPVGAGIAFAGAHGVEPNVRAFGTLLQAIYPWLMTFGLIGLFRRFLGRERPGVRYLSDASYWLYLAHLPLIMAAQLLVRDWQMPALLKFAGVSLSVTAILLLIYQLAVRYTWLGNLLNGPRQRQAKA